jgi:hypothetical protein
MKDFGQTRCYFLIWANKVLRDPVTTGFSHHGEKILVRAASMDPQDSSAPTGRDLISTLALELWDNILQRFVPSESALEMHDAFAFGPTPTFSDSIRPCMDVVRAVIPLASVSRKIRDLVFASTVCRHISLFPRCHDEYDVECDREACRVVDRLVDEIIGARQGRRLCLTLTTSAFDYYHLSSYLGSEFDNLLTLCNRVDLRITEEHNDCVITRVLNVPKSCLTDLSITGHSWTSVTLPSTLQNLQYLHLHYICAFDVSLLKHYSLQSLRLHNTSILSLSALLSLIASEQCPKRLSVMNMLLDEKIDAKALGVWTIWPGLTHLQASTMWEEGVYVDLLARLDFSSVSVLYTSPRGGVEDTRILDTVAVKKCTWIKAGVVHWRWRGFEESRNMCGDVNHLEGGSGSSTLVGLSTLGAKGLLLKWLERLTMNTSIFLKGATVVVVRGVLRASNVTDIEFVDVLDWELGDLEGEVFASDARVVIRKCVCTFAADVISLTSACTLTLEDIYEELDVRDGVQAETVDEWLREVGGYTADLLTHPYAKSLTSTNTDSDF